MSKLIEKNPDVKGTLKKIKEHLKDDLDLEAVFFGCMLQYAKILGEFILEKHELAKLPRNIQYALAQTWNHYALIFEPDKLLDMPYNARYQDYFESGCIDDRFATIVKQLHQICKDENLL